MRRGVGEEGADLARHRAVVVETRLDEDEVGTAAHSRYRRHGGVDAIGSRLIARGRDDAPVHAADSHRPTPQMGIVALPDRRIEGVHIDMDDLAAPRRLARIVPIPSARRRGEDGFRTVKSKWSPYT